MSPVPVAPTPPTTPLLDAYLPLAAAAIRAGCCTATLRRAMKRGQLPARALAGSGFYVVSAPDLAAWIAQRTPHPRNGQSSSVKEG